MLDNRYNLVTQQLRDVQAEQDSFPATSNNLLKQQWQELLDLEKQLRIQRNALNSELNLRYKNLASDSQKEKLTDEFQQRREEFLKETKEPRALAEKIKDKYAELSKDDSVKKALADLRVSTKARLNLGPTAEFRKKSTQLRNAEAELSPKNFVRKPAAKRATKGQERAQIEGRTKRETQPFPPTREKRRMARVDAGLMIRVSPPAVFAQQVVGPRCIVGGQRRVGIAAIVDIVVAAVAVGLVQNCLKRQ